MSGVYVNEKGYLRYSAGPLRDRYVHRVVVEHALGHPIPPGMVVHVHHMDHDRQHNCLPNLLLLDKCIHDHISWCSMVRYAAREPEPPAWVTEAA